MVLDLQAETILRHMFFSSTKCRREFCVLANPLADRIDVFGVQKKTYLL